MRDNMKDLEILYEDNHLIAVNKKISDIVQADKSGDVSLEEKVKAYIKEKYGKPGEVFLGCPHRIDRPVSGVVLFAKTSKALTRLNKMFQEHDEEIVKTYWAIVGNLPEETEGTLTHYMVRDGAKNKSYAYNQPKNGAKKAVPGLQGQCLHAMGLRFLHPRTGETVELWCGLPEEFQAQLRKLGSRG